MSETATETPVPGPCVAWIDGADIAACCGVEYTSETGPVLDEMALESSQLLFEMSGRKYNGGCEQTARPCRTGCPNWGLLGSPALLGTAAWYWMPWQGVWSWWDGLGNALCGCGVESQALLPGYPVTEILEVKIGGVTLPLEDSDHPGFPNYRLDQNRYLTRLGYVDDQGVFQPRWWPACQNLGLDDDQPGTWSVRYGYGIAPPVAGERAAMQLGCELYKACAGGECALPQGVTRVTRQGIEIERGLLLSWSQSVTSRGIRTGSWNTGLTLVDAFLSAYNPWGARRRPAIWSPDLPQFAKRLGS